MYVQLCAHCNLFQMWSIHFKFGTHFTHDGKVCHLLGFLYSKSKILLFGEFGAPGWWGIKQFPLLESFSYFKILRMTYSKIMVRKAMEMKPFQVRSGFLKYRSSCQQSLNRVTLIRSYSAVISAECTGSCTACSITKCDGHIIYLCGAKPISIQVIILIDTT